MADARSVMPDHPLGWFSLTISKTTHSLCQLSDAKLKYFYFSFHQHIKCIPGYFKQRAI